MSRCELVSSEGNRGQFKCPQGHTFDGELVKADPRGKYPAQELIDKLAGYWKRTGVTTPCPQCDNRRRR